MDNKTQKERDQLLHLYKFDSSKYLTDEVLSKMSEHLDSVLSFSFMLILPIIILCSIFALASIGIGYMFDSALFGVIFFILSVFFSVISGGSLGLKISTKNLTAAANAIIRYAFSLTRDIKDIKSGGSSTIKLAHAIKLTVYAVVLPAANIIINQKVILIGPLLYNLIEKITVKLTQIIAEQINAQEVTKNEADDLSSIHSGADMKKAEAIINNIEKYSTSSVRGLSVFCNIIGILSSAIGLLVLSIAMIVFKML